MTMAVDCNEEGVLKLSEEWLLGSLGNEEGIVGRRSKEDGRCWLLSGG